MKPRKHAEVIKAWADGATIEWWNSTYHEWQFIQNPAFKECEEYRIKPEPKPDYFGYIGFDDVCANAGTTNIKEYLHNEWKYKVKITIDGETNKPKSVELI